MQLRVQTIVLLILVMPFIRNENDFARASISSNLNLNESRIQAAVNRQKKDSHAFKFFSSGKLKSFGMRHLPHLSVAVWRKQINHCANLIRLQDLRDDLVSSVVCGSWSSLGL